MTELILEYLLSTKASFQKSTLIRKKAQLGTIVKYCQMHSIEAFHALSDADLDKFIIWRSQLGDSPAFIFSLVNELRTFFDWVEERGDILLNPVNQKLKKPAIPFRRAKSLQEIRDAIAVSTNKSTLRNQCILRLGIVLGLRNFEVRGLNLSDILEFQLNVLGKYGVSRTLPLDSETKEMLDKYITMERSLIKPKTNEDSLALFLSRNRRRISRMTINRVYHEQVGVALTPYDMRHRFAQSMYESGCEIGVLADMLGHKRVSCSLQSYVQVDSINRKKAIFDKYHPMA